MDAELSELERAYAHTVSEATRVEYSEPKVSKVRIGKAQATAPPFTIEDFLATSHICDSLTLPSFPAATMTP